MVPDPVQVEPRSETSVRPHVSQESLVLRNYDGTEAHEVSVRVAGADESIAVDRTYHLPSNASQSVEIRLERAVYLVEATLFGVRTDRAECVLGSGPGEAALVEVGNGLVSVVDGVL